MKLRIGKQIDDTWTIEENELLFDNLRIPKWDEAGNPLPKKPVCESYRATAANKQLNIRFTLTTSGELSGFVHDLKANTMIHFRSISMMTTFEGKDKERNKLAIYTEKFQPPAPSPLLIARTADPACERQWIVIAVETDAEFPGGIFQSVLTQVKYIFDLNFQINVYFKTKQWIDGEPGYPYSDLPQVAVPGTNPTQYRTSISDLFTAFETKGWSQSQPSCNMIHLLTGKTVGTGGGPYGGDSRNRQINCASGKVASSLSASEFMQQSLDQVARVMAHELGHSLAASGSHEMDSPYNGFCYTEINYGQAPNLTPNAIMCISFRLSQSSNQLIGARSTYFSTNFATDIISKVGAVPCLLPSPYLAFGQAYFGGTPINNTPYFATSRNSSISTDITSYYQPSSTQTASLAFDRSVNPGSVYLGSPSVSGSAPLFSGSFYFNAPSNISNATFTLLATTPCETVIRGIPVVFGSAYRAFPNPAQSILTVELLLDKETPNIVDFLPELVVLVSDKNKELKRNEPKKDAANRQKTEPNKVIWDLTDIEPGIYYVHISYGGGVIFKEKILIQK